MTRPDHSPGESHDVEGTSFSETLVINGKNVDLIDAVCAVLRKQDWMMGTAESCTGGGLAKYITETPGVSDVFAGGVISYSNEVKNRILGVKDCTLGRFGAVSAETAVEMVLGLVANFPIQSGISVTGVAGPTGGTEKKPVGLVYISTCVDGDLQTRENRFSNGRSGIREKAVLAALNQFYWHLTKVVGN